MTISCKGSKGIGLNLGYSDKYCTTPWDLEKKWCTTFVDQINQIKPRPKFAVMCGDILDAWPGLGPTEKWPKEKNIDHIRDAQRVDFMNIMGELEIPLVCVCGNHDVGNTPRPKTVSMYRRDFGDDFFSFWCGGVFFIVLNSQYHEDPSQVPDIAAEQDAWLDEQLKVIQTTSCQHSVVFQHIPYFVKTADEDKVYYNYAEPLRSTMLSKLESAGVSKIFTGHYHENAGGWYKGLEVVVTSAIGLQQGEDNNGFRVVEVSEGKIEHKYVELTEF